MAEMCYRPASDKSSCLTVLLTTKIDETTAYSGETGKTVLLSCFRTASNLGLVASVTKDGEAKNVQVSAKAFAGQRCQPEDYQPVTRQFDVYTIEETTDEVDIAWVDAFKDNYFLRLAFARFLRQLSEDRELIFNLQQDDEDNPAGEVEEIDFELYEKAKTFD
ncbi:hypothetical protein HDE_08666 [Halotydeus destructor]|nr:hypothetical protein HDE_08666 [Halotydeus destructor]